MGNFCCSDPEDGREKSPTDSAARPIMQANNDSIDGSSDIEPNEVKSDSRSYNSSKPSKRRNSPSTSSDSDHQPSKPYIIIITGPDLEEVINETNISTTKMANIKRSKPDIIDTTLGMHNNKHAYIHMRIYIRILSIFCMNLFII